MATLLDNAKEGRRYVVLLLSVGLLQVAGYWFAGALVNGAGPLAMPQPDTMLYCQAAARLAEGHPFSFSAGSSVCTGTTSILYPFILAVPYLMGFQGASLVTAGFWLNALFYLAFVAGWGVFVWKRFASLHVRLVAGLMLTLFPQTAYCALSQSDIGLWLAASGVFAAGVAMGNRILYGTILVVGPWVRPEGMILDIAFGMVVLGRFLLARFCLKQKYDKQKNDCLVNGKSDAILVAFGFLSIIGVFALNYALTGAFQFSSIANKGYFSTETLPIAIERTADDLILILRGLLFGQATGFPRTYYALPLFGALFFAIGIFAHNWLDDGIEREFVLLLAVAGGILSVAQSGWQNTNVDRYLAWVMPIFVIFASEGMVKAYGFLRKRSSAAGLVLAVPLLFSAGASVAFFHLFFACSEDSEQIPAFGRDLDRIMPRNTSYGVTGWCGIAYTLPDRRCAQIGGIYSPEFSAKTLNGNLEILRNEPETRFDYWLFAGDDKFPERFKQLQGRQLAVGPDGIEVSHAKWDAFDWGLSPRPWDTNLTLKARIDIGYERDEKRFDYEVVPRYHLQPFPVIARVDKLAGKDTFDTGRVIYGEDEMTLELELGKDVIFVMRTLAEVKFSAKSLLYPSISLTYAYSDPLELHIEIDGKEVGHSHAHIAKEGFTDAVFTIPGKAITHSPCRLSLHGDHVTFCYWFYQ
jgi:hypothetical protein